MIFGMEEAVDLGEILEVAVGLIKGDVRAIPAHPIKKMRAANQKN
jgi:hypothetical protein